jgi:creatinine amidohydrolase
MHGVWIEDLAWPEVANRLKAGAAVLVPVGAIAKEHGFHLPLKTDFLIARELARRVAATLPVLVAPVISFGYYPAFVRYAGSQHLSAATFGALAVELIGNLIGHGARRIAIVNTGVSTEGPLAIAARAILERHGVRVAVANMRELGRSAEIVLENKEGGHADERETSMMLAIDPSAVDLKRAVADHDRDAEAPRTHFRRPAVLDPDPGSGPGYCPTGALGDPSRATAAKGEAILAAMTEDLTDELRRLFPEACALTF